MSNAGHGAGMNVSPLTPGSCVVLILFFSYETTIVEGSIVKPVETKMQFRTERKVPKLGVMLVGLGGNNGWYVCLVTYIHTSNEQYVVCLR